MTRRALVLRSSPAVAGERPAPAGKLRRAAKVFLAAAVVAGSAMASGCASRMGSSGLAGVPDGGVPACPQLALVPSVTRVTAVLASGAGDSDTPEGAPPVQEVALPERDRWPRVFPDAGPFYVLGQFSPYVGQFGVLKDEKRAADGYGIGALFGYRLPLTNALALGLEAQLELSEHKNAAADVAAHQTRIGLGVRALFRFDQDLRPFGVAGFGQYDMTFDSVPARFHLSGQGMFLGGGADYVYMDSLTIRGEITYHFWDAAEKDSGKGGMGQTLFLGVGAAYSF